MNLHLGGLELGSSSLICLVLKVGYWWGDNYTKQFLDYCELENILGNEISLLNKWRLTGDVANPLAAVKGAVVPEWQHWAKLLSFYTHIRQDVLTTPNARWLIACASRNTMKCIWFSGGFIRLLHATWGSQQVRFMQSSKESMMCRVRAEAILPCPLSRAVFSHPWACLKLTDPLPQLLAIAAEDTPH